MLKVFEYAGTGITFDFEGDTFINATEMARPFGKRPVDFIRLKSTQEFIEVLKSDVRNPHFAKRGGDLNDVDQGTWMHELLALEFAGWLAPAFKVWCNKKIKELLTTGSVMSMEDMMIQQLQSMKEQKLRISAVEDRIHQIETRTITSPDYFTIAGFATYNGMNVNLKVASTLGKKAATICRSGGIMMDEIPDPRFGKVRMYPRSVLERVFAEPMM